MKEQTVARFTGLAFLLSGAVELVFSILGIIELIQYGPMLALATAIPDAPPIALIVWILVIVMLLIGIFSVIAGIGWLKYKFEAAA